MSNSNFVTFKRTDFSIPSYIENVAKEFAEHFKVKRDYFVDFTRLLINSKYWRTASIESYLERWKTVFGRIKGRNKIIELVERAFRLCQSDSDINYLRGAIVESLVIAKYGGASVLDDERYGWGAKVYINLPSGTTKEIRYLCNEKLESDCDNRATVDFGHWNGYHAKLYECKVSPMGIGCKELSYMNHLKTEFEQLDISNEVFFVCPETEDSIKARLIEKGASLLYKPVGINELRV